MREPLMKYITKYIGFIIIFILVSQYEASAQSIRRVTTTSPMWTVPIPSITEAGNDYTNTFESATNQVNLNVSVPLLLGNGRVTIHQSNTTAWDNQLQLSIKRNGYGITLCVLCLLSGAENYTNISTTPTSLLEIVAVLALAEYSNIPFQLKLSGVSVTVPAASYETTLVYTIGAL